MRTIALSIIVVMFSVGVPLLYVCMWDYDTLAMEREGFSDTLELISGKFLRHTPEFYEWRIQDREARLIDESENLSFYDDIGVAHDKLGNHDKAIELMLKKDLT
jgi:hypothetical protein